MDNFYGKVIIILLVAITITNNGTS